MRIFNRKKPILDHPVKYAFSIGLKDFYTYENSFNMPMDRMGYMQEKLIELDACLTKKELDLFINLWETELERLLNNPKTKLDSLSKIGFSIEELKKRKEFIIHPEIMLDMLAAVYLLKKEVGKSFSEEVHKEKIELFRDWQKKSPVDFFSNPSFADVFPFLKNSGEDVNKYLAEVELKLASQKEMITRLLQSGSSTTDQHDQKK